MDHTNNRELHGKQVHTTGLIWHSYRFAQSPGQQNHEILKANLREKKGE